jgi:hypothetical protein
MRMDDLPGVSPLAPLALGQSRIEMSDVEALVRRLPGGLPRLMRIVRHVNRALRTIRGSWHSPSATELVVAMDRCDESTDALLERLESPRFREHSRLAAINLLRGAPLDGLRVAKALAGEDSHDGAISESRPKPVCPRKAALAARLERPGDVDARVWSTWSSARQAAYCKMAKNPNAYYYRHVAQDQIQRTGP